MAPNQDMNNLPGKILISVYRRQMEDGKAIKKHIFYNKLREVVNLIHDKYSKDT